MRSINGFIFATFLAGPSVIVVLSTKGKNLCSKSNLRPLIILQKNGEEMLSREEKYIAFSTLESMPCKISNPIKTFISSSLVSYHLCIRDCGNS